MKKYRIKNLDCPQCATKLEHAARRIGGVRFVSINYAAGTMHLDTDRTSAVLDEMKRVEPGIEIAAAAHERGSRERFVEARELVIIAISSVLFAIGMILRRQLQDTPFMWGEYAVFLTAYALCGRGVLWKAARNVLSRRLFDEASLMTIATLGAVAIHQIPEAVGVMLFYKIGEYLQELSVRHSRSSIRALLEIRPEYANLKRDGALARVSPEDVKPGERIIVKPGERIPLDGTIMSGLSQADASALTGESVPRSIGPGDTVLSGMINQTGVIEVEVTRLFQESSAAKMLELVENASSKKAETEKFITKFARYYTPAVVSIALAVAILPPLLLAGASFEDWIYRALVLLVISCPCALVISIPLGYFVGVGSASRRGILVKGANFLDALSKVKTVVFDKTGTLTKGVFKVTSVVPASGFSADDLVRLAAEAESQSNHPIAHSIREAYGKKIDIGPGSDFQEAAGMGIKATVGGRRIIAGNDRLLHQEQVAHDVCVVEGTVIHVAADNTYAGYIVISDELKEDAHAISPSLKSLGVRSILMLTGDERSVAERISKTLHFDGYLADLMPEQKVEAIERIMAEARTGERVAFVGDGINDAPVIARADVGVAMGGLGSDAAVESADVVIMTGMPSKMAEAIAVGKKTQNIIWQNIILALLVKGIFISTGVMGLADMWQAVFADVGVAVLAVFNATRVLHQSR